MTEQTAPDPWEQLAGMTCTCPPGCTVGDTWGDGPRDCEPGCRPCRIMRGQPYVKRRKAKAAQKVGRIDPAEYFTDGDAA